MLLYVMVILATAFGCQNDTTSDEKPLSTISIVVEDSLVNKIDSTKLKPKKKSLPNVVVIVADDLGWTDLGGQGSDFYESPALDKLASEGMKFSNAYANASNCAPTRACLMTGLYAPRHGVYTVGNPARGKSVNRKLIPTPNKTVLNRGLKTLPQSMKDVGYTTCMAGKWHLSDDPKTYGFDQNYGGTHRGSPGSYFSPYKNKALPDGPKGEHLPDRLANDVSGWIKRNKDNSFFLYMPFYSVHTPIQARMDLKTKYDNKAKGSNHNHSAYAAMIEAMDLAVAKVLETIESLNLDENTVVMFTSDNGQFGPVSTSRPLRGSKGMYYEGGIRVPMFVKWPNVVEKNSVSDIPTMSLDLYPTIMDIVGSPADNLDGISLVDVLKGTVNAVDRSLFWHFPAYLEMKAHDRAFNDSHDAPHWRATPCGVIRDGDWKLIEYFESGELELFNLREDISESQDLSEKELVKRDELHEKMKAWRKKTNAPVPTELNPNFQL